MDESNNNSWETLAWMRAQLRLRRLQELDQHIAGDIDDEDGGDEALRRYLSGLYQFISARSDTTYDKSLSLINATLEASGSDLISGIDVAPSRDQRQRLEADIIPMQFNPGLREIAEALWLLAKDIGISLDAHPQDGRFE